MNVLVTGGGTIAPIDDVRSIANTSTGRFSAAISEACLRKGASVWHIHTPYALLPFRRLAGFDLDTTSIQTEHARLDALQAEWTAVRNRYHPVRLPTGTVAEYSDSLRKILTDGPIDIAFLAMAVSDFEPNPVSGKIDSKREGLTIHTHRTPKVIRSVRDWAPGVFLVGFKLLSHASLDRLIQAAESACHSNRADLTVANDLRTLRDGRHTVHLVRPGAALETLGPGPDMADQLVDRVFNLAKAKRV